MGHVEYRLVLFGIGLLGAPVFAMGIGGPAIMAQPSFGYILGFVPAAFLVGLIAGRGNRTFWRGILAGIVGVAAIYVGGAMWLTGIMTVGGMNPGQAAMVSISQGVAPFVLVDGLKVLLVSGIWSVWRGSGSK